MKKTLLVAALFGLLLIIAACAKYGEIKIVNQTETQTSAETANQTGLANPASVFCEEHGGRLKMITNDAGVQGICVLADGTECDEWQYYRGECPAAE